MLMLVLLAVLAGLPQAPAAAEAPLTVAWRDKPPYQYIENGVEQGFLLERTRRAFADAGIAAHFVREPIKRIWVNLKNGRPRYCSSGWYRLAEREAMVQYSAPIYMDPPQSILVAPAAVSRVLAYHSLNALLADPQLTLGLIDGVSYGTDLDARIAKSANRIEKPTIRETEMMRMLAANRVSFMFLDRDDWRYFRDRVADLKDAVLYDLPEMPPGLERYIVCSKDVAPATMDKLNAAIRKITAEENLPDERRGQGRKWPK